MLPKCYRRPFVRVDSAFDIDPESKEVTEKVSELLSVKVMGCSLTGEGLLAFFINLVEKEGLGGANSSLFGK